jgi:hypothetical protein
MIAIPLEGIESNSFVASATSVSAGSATKTAGYAESGHLAMRPGKLALSLAGCKAPECPPGITMLAAMPRGIA